MRSARALAGTALLSAGGLLLEIALTRVLSVLYAQSYVFLVLSVAVLGIGLGAALAALLPGLRRSSTLSLAAALAGLAAFGLVALLTLTMGAPRFLMLAAPLVPYLFVGLALAVLFGLHPEDSSRLYWADLSGAGLGVVLAVPLLNAFGGLGASALAAGLLALAAFFFAGGGGLARGLAGLIVLAALSQVAFSPLGLELRDLATPKPILEALKAGGEVTKRAGTPFRAPTSCAHRAARPTSIWTAARARSCRRRPRRRGGRRISAAFPSSPTRRGAPL